MTWLYEQATGHLYESDGQLIGTGYSGGNCGKTPEGKNNPAMQKIPNVGPIPRGFYRIGTPQDTITHGPYVLHLDPMPTNEMFGRSGFLMHGDSVVHPGIASEGCIIMDRDVRGRVWVSQDQWLQVIEKQPSAQPA